MGTGRVFHKDGPDTEEAIDPALVCMQGTANLFEFVEGRYS